MLCFHLCNKPLNVYNTYVFPRERLTASKERKGEAENEELVEFFHGEAHENTSNNCHSDGWCRTCQCCPYLTTSEGNWEVRARSGEVHRQMEAQHRGLSLKVLARARPHLIGVVGRVGGVGKLSWACMYLAKITQLIKDLSWRSYDILKPHL